MAEKGKPAPFRSRQCMFVLYPESQQDQIDFVQKNYPCAWALHDKDKHTQGEYDRYIQRHDGEKPDWNPGDLKKPHIHFVCRFPNARYFSGIAKELGVPEPTIRKVNNLYKAYVYLWHMLDPDKYQYDPGIVGRHDWEDPSEHAGMSQAEDEQVQILLDMPAFNSAGDMARWAYEQGCWASFKKNYTLWRDIQKERNFHEAAQAMAARMGEPLFPDATPDEARQAYRNAVNKGISASIQKDAESENPLLPVNRFTPTNKPGPWDEE